MSGRRALPAALLAGLLAAGLAGCGRAAQGGADGTATTARTPAPATTRAPATTVAPTTTTRSARAMTAEELVVALRQSGLPILGWTLITGPTDPDHLLGRPGQYTSKVIFSDRRLAGGGGTEAANLADGGAIEVFASAAAAARRAPVLAGRGVRVTRHGRVLLAVSTRLAAASAAKYREALGIAPSNERRRAGLKQM